MKTLRLNLMKVIVGDPLTFSLEHRLYNFLVFLSSCFGLVAFFANMAVDVHWIVQVASITGISVTGILFYLSRTKKIFNLSTIWIFVIAVSIVFSGVYFYNGGLDGPVIYLMIIFLIIFAIISPGSAQWQIFLFLSINILALVLTEYFYPEAILVYASRSLRFEDNLVFIMITLLSLYSSVVAFKKDLLKERATILLQNHKLSDQQRYLEEAVQKAIERNDIISTLLKELNHRVKNNLQVIMGLLSLQINKISDVEVRKPLEDSHRRLSAMVILHQKVYGDQSEINVDMPIYIQEIVNAIFSMSEIEKLPKVEYHLDPLELSIEKALPMGLIINELVTNALKHAYDHSIKNNFIRINIHPRDNLFYLVVEDSGKWKVKKEKGSSFGLDLINMFVRQLKGRINITSDPTRIEISFPAFAMEQLEHS